MQAEGGEQFVDFECGEVELGHGASDELPSREAPSPRDSIDGTPVDSKKGTNSAKPTGRRGSRKNHRPDRSTSGLTVSSGEQGNRRREVAVGRDADGGRGRVAIPNAWALATPHRPTTNLRAVSHGCQARRSRRRRSGSRFASRRCARRPASRRRSRSAPACRRRSPPAARPENRPSRNAARTSSMIRAALKPGNRSRARSRAWSVTWTVNGRPRGGFTTTTRGDRRSRSWEEEHG